MKQTEEKRERESRTQIHHRMLGVYELFSVCVICSLSLLVHAVEKEERKIPGMQMIQRWWGRRGKEKEEWVVHADHSFVNCNPEKVWLKTRTRKSTTRTKTVRIERVTGGETKDLWGRKDSWKQWLQPLSSPYSFLSTSSSICDPLTLASQPLPFATIDQKDV